MRTYTVEEVAAECKPYTAKTIRSIIASLGIQRAAGRKRYMLNDYQKAQ